MNEPEALQINTLELQRMLEQAGDNPLMARQLRARLEEAGTPIETTKQPVGTLVAKQTVDLPRFAIFLCGQAEKESVGIRPGLAGEALIQFEKMFVAQALHDERAAARQAGRQRRPKGTPIPSLMFTGTPRGSFGLEFVVQATRDSDLLRVYEQSLQNVAKALVTVSQSDSRSLSEVIGEVPATMLQSLKQFMKTLAQNGTELRIAFPDGQIQSLGLAEVRSAAERLERDLSQSTETVAGVFRGVTHESGYFDLKLPGGEVITGLVADDLCDDDIDRIDTLTNHLCQAKLQKTNVKQIKGTETSSYVLLDAQAETTDKGVNK
jgi:hypothetical protein